MKISLVKGLWMLCAVLLIASCSGSKKQPSRIGKVIVVQEGKAAGKDNGLHKGWYKNPNNPHHPQTTKKPGKAKPGNGAKAGKSKKK